MRGLTGEGVDPIVEFAAAKLVVVQFVTVGFSMVKVTIVDFAVAQVVIVHFAVAQFVMVGYDRDYCGRVWLGPVFTGWMRKL